MGLIASPVWAGTETDASSTATVTTRSVTQPVPDAASSSLAEQERIRQLGIDPAIGNKFRPGEARTALRIESERAVTLMRAPDDDINADWLDSHGKSYDAVGNFPSKYFPGQWSNLQRQILLHLNKADFVPVDVSRFKRQHKNQVREFITGHPEFNSRVFVVGNEESSDPDMEKTG